MQVGPYSAHVVVRGRPVTEYHHEGSVYVEGRKGSEFDLRFRNMNGRSVLVVPSVDGLSVMDGKPAGNESSGYIVRGYSTLDIPGWRLNNREIAKFIFQDRRRSYAGQSGDGENVGVIGFLVFEERSHYVSTPIHYPLYGSLHAPSWNGPFYPSASGSVSYDSWSPTSHVASNASSSRATFSTSTQSISAKQISHPPTESFSIGTGFGRAGAHEVKEVNFQRKSSSPDARLVLFYDHRKNLERIGIRIENKRTRQGYDRPNAFPAMQTGCTPPPGWRG